MAPTPPLNPIVMHLDDVGMCHGANLAFFELSALGTLSSGSVMVPCPWFLEVAEMAATSPALDIGVHLTLTSEKTHYRWRPLTAPAPSAGLTDRAGYFWPDVPAMRGAHVEAVEAECRAQIDLALSSGIDATHIDCHMGAMLSPEFCDLYVALGEAYRLPVLLTPTLERYAPRGNLGPVADAAPFAQAVKRAVGAGMPLFERVLETAWDDAAHIDARYQGMITARGDGPTFFALHANAPGEIDVIDPPLGATVRTAEYALLRHPEFKAWLAAHGGEVVGLRPYRDAYRTALTHHP